MTEVILIRPGSTDFDDQNRIQGALNLPLNAKGEQEVDAIVDQMQHHQVDIIFTGPCKSARSTAERIGNSLGIPVKEKEDLQNLNQGLWQGLQIEEVRRKYPKVYKQWLELPESVCPPEGENVSDAMERIKKALKKPIKKKSSFAIVVPDPLASLVGSVIRQEKPHLGTISRNDQPDVLRVEVLEKDGQIIQPESPCGSCSSSNRKTGNGNSEGRAAEERTVQ